MRAQTYRPADRVEELALGNPYAWLYLERTWWALVRTKTREVAWRKSPSWRTNVIRAAGRCSSLRRESFAMHVHSISTVMELPAGPFTTEPL